ncbi:hypothetical protein LguiA_035241 [Lonicera macranthoides]
MAQKRHTLIDALPSASASSEEEQSSSSSTDASSADEKRPSKSKSKQLQEEDSKSKPSQDGNEEEDSESEESSDEEAEEEKSPPIPPPVEKKPSVQKPKSESEFGDDDSASESDSGYTQQSPSASAFTIKPILTKQMPNSSDPKKPAMKPAGKSSSTPVKPTGKRPADTQQNGKDSRGKKSKVPNKDEEDGRTEEKIEEKKSAITRLWTEKDEVTVLNGMIRYKSEKESDPYADLGAFHEFVKDSLRAEVSKNQLTDKIRRLKKKYLNNAEKGENGEDPVFSRPHEYKTFEISKKIWGNGAAITNEGNGGDVDNGTSNNSTTRKNRKIETIEAKPKEEPKAIVTVVEPVKDEPMADEKDFFSTYPRLYQGFNMENSVYLPLSDDGRRFLKENINLIGSSKAKELDIKWRNLQVEEFELYSKRMELITEQSKLLVDAVKSSKDW